MGNNYPLFLINDFPDASKHDEFNPGTYKAKFGAGNFIVRAKTKSIEYGNHWGVLSIKFALNGTEFYKSKNGFYGVNESRYLILNNGTSRSSYINSDQEVESFTISFSPQFESEVLSVLLNSENNIVDDPFYIKEKNIHFTEMLYEHNDNVSPILFKILSLSNDWEINRDLIAEQLTFLIEGLVATQVGTWKQMRSMPAIKPATQKELYIRLHRAKDYIYSSYREEVSLKDMANVACLNSHYFLREFKKTFHYTPNQYLQQVRMNEAKRLIATTRKMISEVCAEVGFADHPSFTKLFKRHFNESPSQARLKQVVS